MATLFLDQIVTVAERASVDSSDKTAARSPTKSAICSSALPDTARPV